MPGPIIPSSGGGGVTVHANLTGLSADDHPQYLNNARADVRYVPLTLADAKGDLIAASADNVWGKLSVGTDGQVLTADAASGAGVKWSDALTVTSLSTNHMVISGAQFFFDGAYRLTGGSGLGIGMDCPLTVYVGGFGSVIFGITAAGRICTNQKIAASVGVGAIADKLPVYDVDGTTLLGYIPVYATIT